MDLHSLIRCKTNSRKTTAFMRLAYTGLSLALLVATTTASANTQATIDSIRNFQAFDAALAVDDLDAALGFAQRAHQMNLDAYGPNDLLLTESLRMLALTAERRNNLASAANHYAQIVTLQRSNLPTNDPSLLRSLEDLLRVQLLRGEVDAAEALLLDILQMEKQIYGPRHANVATTLNRLRDLYTAQAETEKARSIDVQIQSLETTARGFALTKQRHAADEGSATVRVYYGTNRARTGAQKAALFYGGERGDLEVGYVDVNIPASHKYGELEVESRWSIFTYILGDDAKRRRYVLLLDVQPLEHASFQESLKQHIADAPSNDIFLFVHGYNSSFEDASLRAAQLAYDLDFDGTPMLYSWPSQGSTAAYTVDEAAVRVSGKKMATFLDDVLATGNVGRIHLIGHSMGNRALLEALQTYLLQHRQQQEAVFDQVVFTAPDVDRDYFVDALDQIQSIAKRVTLYASDNDVALMTSQLLHGAPRAGLAGENIITRSGLDTIDMSEVEADLLGHNYYAADEGAIYDLFRLLWRGDPPAKRCGMTREIQDVEKAWAFNVEQCRGDELLQAGLLLKRFGARARAQVTERILALSKKADGDDEDGDDDDEEEKEEWSRILSRLDGLLTTED